MKNFLEESLVDLDNEILDFVESNEFKVLNKILKNLYISQSLITENEGEPLKIAYNNGVLKTFLNLCPDLQSYAENVLEERKKNNQSSNLVTEP